MVNAPTAETRKSFRKQLKRILAGTGVVVVFGALLVWGSYHALTLADRRTEEVWRQGRRIIQRQLDLAQELVTLLQGPFPELKKPLGRLESSRQELLGHHRSLAARATQGELSTYEKTQQKMTADIERVLGAVSGTPSVAKDNRFLGWVGCYRATQRLLDKEKGRYNSLASAYNRLYGYFFIHSVAEKFHLHRRPLFKAHGR